jgi:hypothetical protein
MSPLRHGLRLAAIAIAFTAVIDPAIERQFTVTEPLTIVAVGENALARARELRQRVGEEATLMLHASGTTAAACPATGACVAVSDGTLPSPVTAAARR